MEFCSRYFSAAFEPYPLFGLMMPRFVPGIEIENGTGRFLRNGQPPRQKVFEKSVARLFDFLAVLIHWRKHRRFPEQIPLVKDMAAWCTEDEARIVSWRDETTRFTANNFFNAWKAATGPDKHGIYIGAPLPMLVAAHLWSPLLVRDDGKTRQLFMCTDGYELWWTRNLERLTTKGLKFGRTPWPKCLTNVAEGNRSLAHFHFPPDLP